MSSPFDTSSAAHSGDDAPADNVVDSWETLLSDEELDSALTSLDFSDTENDEQTESDPSNMRKRSSTETEQENAVQAKNLVSLKAKFANDEEEPTATTQVSQRTRRSKKAPKFSEEDFEGDMWTGILPVKPCSPVEPVVFKSHGLFFESARELSQYEAWRLEVLADGVYWMDEVCNKPLYLPNEDILTPNGLKSSEVCKQWQTRTLKLCTVLENPSFFLGKAGYEKLLPQRGVDRDQQRDREVELEAADIDAGDFGRSSKSRVVKTKGAWKDSAGNWQVSGSGQAGRAHRRREGSRLQLKIEKYGYWNAINGNCHAGTITDEWKQQRAAKKAAATKATTTNGKKRYDPDYTCLRTGAVSGEAAVLCTYDEFERKYQKRFAGNARYPLGIYPNGRRRTVKINGLKCEPAELAWKMTLKATASAGKWVFSSSGRLVKASTPTSKAPAVVAAEPKVQAVVAEPCELKRVDCFRQRVDCSPVPQRELPERLRNAKRIICVRDPRLARRSQPSRYNRHDENPRLQHNTTRAPPREYTPRRNRDSDAKPRPSGRSNGPRNWRKR